MIPLFLVVLKNLYYPRLNEIMNSFLSFFVCFDYIGQRKIISINFLNQLSKSYKLLLITATNMTSIIVENVKKLHI